MIARLRHQEGKRGLRARLAGYLSGSSSLILNASTSADCSSAFSPPGSPRRRRWRIALPIPDGRCCDLVSNASREVRSERGKAVARQNPARLRYVHNPDPPFARAPSHPLPSSEPNRERRAHARPCPPLSSPIEGKGSPPLMPASQSTKCTPAWCRYFSKPIATARCRVAVHTAQR